MSKDTAPPHGTNRSLPLYVLETQACSISFPQSVRNAEPQALPQPPGLSSHTFTSPGDTCVMQV